MRACTQVIKNSGADRDSVSLSETLPALSSVEFLYFSSNITFRQRGAYTTNRMIMRGIQQRIGMWHQARNLWCLDPILTYPNVGLLMKHFLLGGDQSSSSN